MHLKNLKTSMMLKCYFLGKLQKHLVTRFTLNTVVKIEKSNLEPMFDNTTRVHET